MLASQSIKSSHGSLNIIDLRGCDLTEIDRHLSATICDRCPQSWQDLNTIVERAHQANQSLALAYPRPEQINGAIVWQTLVGIAKYLSRTGQEIRRSQLVSKLGIEDTSVLQIGFNELQKYGYDVSIFNDEQEQIIRINLTSSIDNSLSLPKQFIQAANELAFQQQFFDRQLTSLS